MHVPWRTIQAVINLCTIVTCFCTFLPLGYVSSYFSWNCVLFADIQVLSVNSTAIYVDKERTVWGATSTCSFTTYSPVLAGIHAFIWCWYFLLMKEQLKSEHKEFPLLMTSFLLHSVLCIEIFVASGMISAGIDIWCRNLVAALQKNQLKLTCSDTQKLDWPNIYSDNKKHPIYSFLVTAKISCWLQTLTILCQTLVCGYKLYVWILGLTGDNLNLRKCGRSDSDERCCSNGGYTRDDADNDADSVYSLETGTYHRLSDDFS